MARNDPTFEYVQSRRYPSESLRRLDGSTDEGTVVVEFPCEFPYGTPTAATVGWRDMLKMQEDLQREWADNAVSITVYYKQEELPAIREHMAENWDKLKSVSFLPVMGHGFDQAPLEAISIPEYERRLAAIDTKAEVTIRGESTLIDADCETGACPIR